MSALAPLSRDSAINLQKGSFKAVRPNKCTPSCSQQRGELLSRQAGVRASGAVHCLLKEPTSTYQGRWVSKEVLFLRL